MPNPFNATRLSVSDDRVLLAGPSGLSVRRISDGKVLSERLNATGEAAYTFCAMRGNVIATGRVIRQDNPAILGLSLYDSSNVAVTKANHVLPSVPRVVVGPNATWASFQENGRQFLREYFHNGTLGKTIEVPMILVDMCLTPDGENLDVFSKSGVVSRYSVSNGQRRFTTESTGINNGIARITSTADTIVVTSNAGTWYCKAGSPGPSSWSRTTLPLGAISIACAKGTIFAGYAASQQAGTPPLLRRIEVATGTRLPDLGVPAQPNDLAVHVDKYILASSDSIGFGLIPIEPANDNDQTSDPGPNPVGAEDKGLRIALQVTLGPAGPGGKRAVLNATGDAQPVA